MVDEPPRRRPSVLGASLPGRESRAEIEQRLAQERGAEQRDAELLRRQQRADNGSELPQSREEALERRLATERLERRAERQRRRDEDEARLARARDLGDSAFPPQVEERQRRGPLVETMPLPERPPPSESVHIRIPPHLWKRAGPYIISAVIGLLSGSGASVATKEVKDEIEDQSLKKLKTDGALMSERLSVLEERLAQLATREHRRAQTDAKRWDLHSAMLCRLNDGPWEQGTDCGSYNVTFESKPNNFVYVGPRFKAKAEWAQP